jgi:hypothetical protein
MCLRQTVAACELDPKSESANERVTATPFAKKVGFFIFTANLTGTATANAT